MRCDGGNEPTLTNERYLTILESLNDSDIDISGILTLQIYLSMVKYVEVDGNDISMVGFIKLAKEHNWVLPNV